MQHVSGKKKQQIIIIGYSRAKVCASKVQHRVKRFVKPGRGVKTLTNTAKEDNEKKNLKK